MLHAAVTVTLGWWTCGKTIQNGYNSQQASKQAVYLQGGCIIRAGFLDDIKNAYKRNPDLENLVLDDWFADKLVERNDAWRDVVKLGITSGGHLL